MGGGTTGKDFRVGRSGGSSLHPWISDWFSEKEAMC